MTADEIKELYRNELETFGLTAEQVAALGLSDNAIPFFFALCNRVHAEGQMKVYSELSIMFRDALTVEQAAEIFKVPVEHVEDLLQRGAMRHCVINGIKYIVKHDVLQKKREMDGLRLLMRISEEYGLYDDEINDLEAKQENEHGTEHCN